MTLWSQEGGGILCDTVITDNITHHATVSHGPASHRRSVPFETVTDGHVIEVELLGESRIVAQLP